MFAAYDHVERAAKAAELTCPAYDRLLQYLINRDHHEPHSVSQTRTPPVVMHSDLWATTGAILRDMRMSPTHWRNAACACNDLLAVVHAESSVGEEAVKAAALHWFEQALASSSLSRNGRMAVGAWALAVVACTLALLRHAAVTIHTVRGNRRRSEATNATDASVNNDIDNDVNDDVLKRVDSILIAEPVRPFFGWHGLGVSQHNTPQPPTSATPLTNAGVVQPAKVRRAKSVPPCIVCPQRVGQIDVSQDITACATLMLPLIGTVANVLSTDLARAQESVRAGVCVMWPTAGGSFCAQHAALGGGAGVGGVAQPGGPQSAATVADYPVTLDTIMVLHMAVKHVWEEGIIRPRRMQMLRAMLVGIYTTRIELAPPSQHALATAPATSTSHKQHHIVEHETDENSFLALSLRGIFAHTSSGAVSVTLPSSTATTNVTNARSGSHNAQGVANRLPNDNVRAEFDSSSSDDDSDDTSGGGGDDDARRDALEANHTTQDRIQAVMYAIPAANVGRFEDEYDPEAPSIFDASTDLGLFEGHKADAVAPCFTNGFSVDTSAAAAASTAATAAAASATVVEPEYQMSEYSPEDWRTRISEFLSRYK